MPVGFTSTLWIACGGALGTLGRYGLTLAVTQALPIRFPLGTLSVNALGCLLIGLIATLADEAGLLTSAWRQPLVIGFLGGFTTFSSFAYETWQLYGQHDLKGAGLNILASLVLCFGALLIGVLIARSLAQS